MKVAVIGTGSWGTALAKVLAENHHQVMMWGRDLDVIDEINQAHRNHRYLGQTVLPEALVASGDLEEVVKDAEAVLFVLPTAAMRSVATQVNQVLEKLGQAPIIIHATKGLEPGSHARISQVLDQVIQPQNRAAVVVLSGPSHAEEVARQDLTTITAASGNLAAAKVVQDLFMNHFFRVYTNQDVIGVELGAALKNIIALGAGALVGLGYGDNAKAGLVTRGLAEISRMGVHLGADPLTFLGLSGVGDLVVTCTSPHSRNWQAGRLLALGYNRMEIQNKIDMVVEGVSTTQVAYELAQAEGVDMPITQAIYRALYEGVRVEDAIADLMAREGKQEAATDQGL